MVTMQTTNRTAPRPTRPVRSGILTLLAILLGTVLAASLVGLILLSVMGWLRSPDETASAQETSVSVSSDVTSEEMPQTGPLSEGDGLIPAGTDVTAGADLPAVTRLDPALRAAVEAATAEAALDDQPLYVTTGWRSARYQGQLYEEGLATYGSEEVARQFVATPETSTHVTGTAVDIGPLDAMYWLLEHGPAYGLCQTYANEIWHFELATTPGGTCPEMLPDASHLGG